MAEAQVVSRVTFIDISRPDARRVMYAQADARRKLRRQGLDISIRTETFEPESMGGVSYHPQQRTIVGTAEAMTAFDATVQATIARLAQQDARRRR